MGIKAKEHRKKVAKRNELLKQEANRTKKEFAKTVKQFVAEQKSQQTQVSQTAPSIPSEYNTTVDYASLFNEN